MIRARRRAAWVAASVASALVLTGAVQAVILDHSTSAPAAAATSRQDVVTVERPLANDCSGGHVTFTFDDGPRENTEKVLDALEGFGIDAVFFWNGQRVIGREHTVARALAEGHVIGNHAWDHPDLTTGERPDGTQEGWDAQWVRDELARTNEVLVAAGAPRPKLYRPPYGAVNRQVDSVAGELGLRLVMPWGYHRDDNIVDTQDYEGVSPEEIIEATTPWMRDESIITMHDGQADATLNSIDALQGIVDVMNEKRLCATTEVRPDATGRVLERQG